MTTNFGFLKKVDGDLFEIIDEAEHLYRDEYFEQCMAQTRRFGENVCRQVLGNKRTIEDTFDEMLATLKDNAIGEEQEKEFLDDLYFLKKCGNDAVHSGHVKRRGMDALECLKRAFEVAINYSVYNRGANNSILKLNYDTELLVTGKKSKKSLAEKYEEEKEVQAPKKTSKSKSKSTSTSGSKRVRKPKKQINLFPVGWSFGNKNQKTEKVKKQKAFKKQSYTVSSATPQKGVSVFWIIVGVSSFISLIAILVMFVASKF